MKQLALRLPIDLIEKLDGKIARIKEAEPLAGAERSVLIRTLIEEAIESREKRGKW